MFFCFVLRSASRERQKEQQNDENENLGENVQVIKNYSFLLNTEQSAL